MKRICLALLCGFLGILVTAVAIPSQVTGQAEIPTENRSVRVSGGVAHLSPNEGLVESITNLPCETDTAIRFSGGDEGAFERVTT
jgi:hypothetical protein